MLDTKGCRGQLMNIAQRLLSIDSPSGFTDQVVREAEQIARDHGYAVRRTNKGNLVVSVPGREKGKRVGLCAHIDTLGLMVRSITADGMLMTTRIGGPILPTLDGEYCRIHTRDGRIYTGTILSLSPASPGRSCSPCACWPRPTTAPPTGMRRTTRAGSPSGTTASPSSSLTTVFGWTTNR